MTDSKINIEQALEMARCAKINLENTVKTMPGLEGHPFLCLVRMQIEQCIENLGGGI